MPSMFGGDKTYQPFWILDGRTPVPCTDIREHILWSATPDHHRIVKQTDTGSYFISTVFVGLNYAFVPEQEPLVFETAIFDSNPDFPNHDRELYRRRHSTWDQAEQGHEEAIEWLKREYGGI